METKFWCYSKLEWQILLSKLDNLTSESLKISNETWETSTPLNETHFFRGFDYGIETYNEIRINLDFEFEEGKTYSLELT